MWKKLCFACYGEDSERKQPHISKKLNQQSPKLEGFWKQKCPKILLIYAFALVAVVMLAESCFLLENGKRCLKSLFLSFYVFPSKNK